MPFEVSSDYWVEIPGGRFTVGLLPEEARRLAEESAKDARLDPPTPGLNEARNLRRWAEWEETDCNVEWLTEYLLAHYPARDVELEPFAIARRPVTNAEYQRFIAETGELEPRGWGYPPKPEDPDAEARDVDWIAALALVDWAGARLPFEAEWERAIRGSERRLFPWGNAFARYAPFTTPEGITTATLELCADIWREPPGLDRARWGEEAPSEECRCLKGGGSILERPSIISAVARCPAWLARYGGGTAGALRLVRADGRRIPPPTRDFSRSERALLDVRAFEMKVVKPALAQLRASRVATDHAIDLGSCQQIGSWLNSYDAPASEVKHDATFDIRVAGSERGNDVRRGFSEDPAIAASSYNDGLHFVARSRETFRRVPAEHGVFAWGIGYRLADDGQVRALHVAAFRMAFDRRVHTLRYQFREGEVDTPIRDITGDMVTAAVLGAFDFYEAHADEDRSPF